MTQQELTPALPRQAGGHWFEPSTAHFPERGTLQRKQEGPATAGLFASRCSDPMPAMRTLYACGGARSNKRATNKYVSGC
jgi:hypothetical protein